METDFIVSNTSPIINLARIGYLDLVPALYTKLVIPSAVFDEVTGLGLIAVLLEAKHRQHIAMVRPVLDALIHDAGFRINSELYRSVLSASAEIDA